MTADPLPSPTTQAPGRTTADLLAFLDRAFHAGLLTQPTAASCRLGANRVLSALPEHATADLPTLNPDHAIAVFEDAEGETISATTRRQYAGSFRKALILFSSYVAEPERWHQLSGTGSGTGSAPGWTAAADGGQELTIPLPRHRSMRLHLPPGVTANDTRLAKRLISSYLNEIPAARDGQG